LTITGNNDDDDSEEAGLVAEVVAGGGRRRNRGDLYRLPNGKLVSKHDAEL
jgi:hypothetical protein